MLERCKPRHIFYKAQDRHIDLVAGEHCDTLASISKSHFLRSADHYYACDRESLYESEVDVGCARRHINEEVVEFAPVGIGDELTQCVACHTATPKHSAIFVDYETDGEQLDAIFLHWYNLVDAVDLFHVELLIFKTKHFRHRRTEDVGIEKTDLVAFCCESDSKVGSDSRFTYATFARRYADDVLNARKWIGRLFRDRTTSLDSDVAFDFDISTDIGEDSSFSRSDHALHEWVGRFVKDEREGDLASVDADIVFDHVVFDKVFAVARIANGLEGLGDESRIYRIVCHCFDCDLMILQ